MWISLRIHSHHRRSSFAALRAARMIRATPMTYRVVLWCQRLRHSSRRRVNRVRFIFHLLSDSLHPRSAGKVDFLDRESDGFAKIVQIVSGGVLAGIRGWSRLELIVWTPFGARLTLIPPSSRRTPNITGGWRNS